LGNCGRLFDVFRGPHATLIAFDLVTHGYGEAVKVYPVGQEDAEVRRIYDVGRGYVLVRPDGYIGEIAPDEADVQRFSYLF
jgi:hypothetical protein